MRLLITPTFERTAKKLHPQQKSALNDAVRAVAGNPDLGELKVGDLGGVQACKFHMGNQLALLAYRVMDQDTLRLLMVGPRENFCRDLERLER